MALRKKSEIVSNLFKTQTEPIAEPPLKDINPASMEVEEKPDPLIIIIEKKPKTKFVREYFKMEVDDINQAAELEFMNKSF